MAIGGVLSVKERTLSGELPGKPVVGVPGKSAYQYALEAGYGGTEQEFAQDLATAGIYILAEGETLDDVPEAADVIIVPFGNEEGTVADPEEIQRIVEEYLGAAGVVKTVNGIAPDDNGNVEVEVGSSALYVTIDENGLASHSASEILAAAEGGQEVYLIADGARLTLTHGQSGAAQFIIIFNEGGPFYAITASVAEDKTFAYNFLPINTEVWYVTVTGDESHGYTADRDYLEIYDAYRAGMTVLCRLTINESSFILAPASIQETASVFFLADVGTSVRLSIDDKGATVTLGEYVTSVNGKTKTVTLTAGDVGALPDDTVIPTVPTNISAFQNDAGYLTEHQDLSGYAKTGDIPDAYTKAEIDAIMGAYINDIDTLVGGDA